MFRHIAYLVIAILFLGAATPPALFAQAKDKKKDAKDKKDEAKRSVERMRQYMKQLHARFETWDDNNDNKLDAKELARAFRGPKAEPLDTLKIALPTPEIPGKPVVYVETIPGKVRPLSLALVTFPEPFLAPCCAVAELLAERPKEVTKVAPPPPVKGTPPPKVPDITRFADYQFLAIAGKGKDWVISRAEFEAFAKQYAKLLDELEESEHDVAQAKARLAKAGPKAKKEVQADLQRALAAHVRAEAQWQSIPLAVHQTFKIKH